MPIRTLADLIAYAKANRANMSYGSAGAGSMTHLAAELFKSLIGTPELVHVPYRGAGPSIADLVSGHIPLVMPNITGQVLDLNASGKLRLLAVTTPKRLAAAPDIPTTQEAGLDGMIAQNFVGLFAPAQNLEGHRRSDLGGNPGGHGRRRIPQGPDHVGLRADSRLGPRAGAALRRGGHRSLGAGGEERRAEAGLASAASGAVTAAARSVRLCGA